MTYEEKKMFLIRILVLEMLSVLSVLDTPGSGIDKDELLFSIKSKHKELMYLNVIFKLLFSSSGFFF